MSKAITQTTSGHNLRVMMAIVALAALLLVLTLVAVLQRAPTTTDRGEANPAMNAESQGGPRSVGYDPTIDRGEANPAMSAEGKGGSTRSANDDPIERHAEVVQRLGNGSLR
jgi:hypothetical protein